jgi:serine/threonine-protein kinase
VAHPNVCRVFDVGELDGLMFLSMEYVDGEDLASLLRRVGRLPEDRAVQVARQLCAGLAAAHDQGILHRDLKPANVMIDGRGRARITDFGLAVLAGAIGGHDIRSGTPAYMAPEQLAGREVTVKSDLYCLGLVLYELFTGQAAFGAVVAAHGAARTRETTPISPSSHVKGLDAAVERVLLRCLEPDPADRPSSAVALAAALPGGDPLAAMIAAGETPSPEMVAAAGGVGGLRPALAAACLALVAVGVFACAWVSDRVNPVLQLSLEKPPEVLRDVARQILQEIGHVEAAVDARHGFDSDRDYARYAGGAKALGERKPGGAELFFWYRESPHLLLAGDLLRGPVDFLTPAPSAPGMAGVRLDTEGRLLELLDVPRGDAPALERPWDWSGLFARAGLDPTDWRAVEPEPIPPLHADARLAWEARDSADPATALRVEAGAFRGRPVYFRIVGPWGRPDPSRPRDPAWGMYGLLAVLAAAVFLARRNLRLGRGDVNGALVLGVFSFLAGFLGFGVLHEGARILGAPIMLFANVAFSAVFASVAAASYLALEPFVRRRWPDTLTSWARLVGGRFRDPLVGRDLLLGALFAVPLALLDHLSIVLRGPGARELVTLEDLLGGRHVLATILFSAGPGVVTAMTMLLIFVIFHALLRRTWAAFLVTIALETLMLGVGNRADLANLLFVSLALAVLLRLGLLAAIAALACHTLLAHTIITTQLDAWYSDMTIGAIAAILALAGYGFVTSRAGKPLFGDRVLEA